MWQLPGQGDSHANAYIVAGGRLESLPGCASAFPAFYIPATSLDHPIS